LVAQVEGELGGVRPGHQIGGADQIEEMRITHPAPATHHLVVHHRDVRCRAAEGGEAQLEEEQHQFAHRVIVRCPAGPGQMNSG
jgi:hypothetical protein